MSITMLITQAGVEMGELCKKPQTSLACGLGEEDSHWMESEDTCVME